MPNCPYLSNMAIKSLIFIAPVCPLFCHPKQIRANVFNYTSIYLFMYQSIDRAVLNVVRLFTCVLIYCIKIHQVSNLVKTIYFLKTPKTPNNKAPHYTLFSILKI